MWAAAALLATASWLEHTSALGHKRKWCHVRVMSVLPLKADIRRPEWHVRYGHKRKSSSTAFDEFDNVGRQVGLWKKRASGHLPCMALK